MAWNLLNRIVPRTLPEHMTSVRSLDDVVADELSRRAGALAQEWVDGIERTRPKHRPTSALIADLREHIPTLVRGIVEYMRTPDAATHANVVERLRLHADRRRALGYDIHELLTDFEVLSRLVFKAFTETVGRFEEHADVREVAELAGRLREALMEITSDAVGMYRDAELEQRRVLGTKLSEFAQTMAHELKNPLGAAQSGFQMLQDTDVVKTADDRDRFTRLVLRNLVRMQDLIQDIRALVTADGAEREERWAELDGLIAKVFAELEPQAAARGVRLAIEGSIPVASVDVSRLEIALVNLVGNAIKYSDHTKADPHVVVSACKANENTARGAWRIEIRDNGLGIPAAAQHNVFNKHFRAHPTVAEGTGFGLAIVGELVKGAGGRLWFDSEEKRGTTFYLVVPDGGERRIGERRKTTAPATAAPA